MRKIKEAGLFEKVIKSKEKKPDEAGVIFFQIDGSGNMSGDYFPYKTAIKIKEQIINYYKEKEL